MINWYLRNRHLLRALQAKAIDALRHCEGGELSAAKTIAEYMRTDFQQLADNWHSRYAGENFGYLSRHLAWAEANDFSDMIKTDLPAVESKLDELLVDYEKSLPGARSEPYVAEERIQELAEIGKHPNFDTSKLITMLRELNAAYKNDAHLTVGILVRAVIDHVPPIFGCGSFVEVANNSKGTKSFRGAMKRLNESLRNLADSYLHVQIRKIESLPTNIQVDFRAELDSLLSEVSRVLQDV